MHLSVGQHYQGPATEETCVRNLHGCGQGLLVYRSWGWISHGPWLLVSYFMKMHKMHRLSLWCKWSKELSYLMCRSWRRTDITAPALPYSTHEGSSHDQDRGVLGTNNAERGYKYKFHRSEENVALVVRVTNREMSKSKYAISLLQIQLHTSVDGRWFGIN